MKNKKIVCVFLGALMISLAVPVLPGSLNYGAFAAEVAGRGASSKMKSLADYALSVCELTPRPEWDHYVRECYESYESLPPSPWFSYLTTGRTRDAEEMLQIANYVNNEFGFSRGVYVDAYRLTGGGCTLGFERTDGKSGAKNSYLFAAEKMKEKAQEMKGETETETLDNIFRYTRDSYSSVEIPEGGDPRDYYYGWFSGNTLNCNGRAKMISMMSRMNGLNAQVVFGKYNGADHAWAEVMADGVLWQCDAALQPEKSAELSGNYEREPGWPELVVR